MRRELLDPDRRYLEDLESITWLEQSKGGSGKFLYFILFLGIALSLSVVLITSFDLIVSDPTARWTALAIIIIIVGIVVLSQVAKAEPRRVRTDYSRGKEGFRGPLERLRESIERGAKGSSYAQMLSILELRNAFRGKVMMLRGYNRAALSKIISDETELHRAIKDEDLENLLAMDLKKEFMVREVWMDRKRFQGEIMKLIQKVEDWR
jgi:hypothetical protein